MMYVLPMLLGQTYDLGKDKPGLLIYPRNITDEAVQIQQYFTDSQYRMVENAEQMKDFLDVSGKLSLKIKGGMLDVSGEGRYLKDSSAKSNGLEILVKLHFETVTMTIPSSKKPNSDWTTFPRRFLGTHYLRSLVFGGDLVASIRISGSGKEDLQRIKGAVSAGLKVGEGSFEGDIKGKLEMLKQSGLESSSMEINYYASVPIQGVSYSIDGLLKLVDNFPDHVKKVNKGLGNPLRMELYPLSSLDEGFTPYLENRALSDELDDLDSQFDDLRDTRQQLSLWISQLPPDVPNSAQKMIDDFANDLNSVYSIYVNTIGELDVAQGASTDPVKKAFEAYRGGDYVLPKKYGRKFRSLQKRIYKEVPELQPNIGGAYYIHWGRSDCSSPNAETSLSGVAAASVTSQNGGSSNFLCSPLNPEQADPKNYFENFKPTKYDLARNLLLSPIKYKGIMDRFKPMFNKNFACANCRIGNRTATLVKMAATSCPDKWVKEYEGYVMAPGTFSTKFGEYICVDQSMKEPNGNIAFGGALEAVQEILEVSVSCGALSCERYKKSKPIPCVVCTI